jgi:hypothetical protein
MSPAAKSRAARTPVARRSRPLWRCPKCGRTFANRNQTHSCGRHDLEHHFENKPHEVHALYDRFVAKLSRLGPVTVLPEKSRIAFHVRMSFAQVTPRRHGLDGHVVLARRREHPQVHKIETISARNHVHHFRLASTADLTPELMDLLREGYEVGEQGHLEKK